MALKVWNGSSWVSAIALKVWNGSAWVAATAGKVWNGSAWIDFLGDIILDAINWGNVSLAAQGEAIASTSNTVSGITSTVNLKVTTNVVRPSGTSLTIFVNGVEANSFVSLGSSNATFNVTNSANVTFEFVATTTGAGTIGHEWSGTATVTNETAGGTVLDTFTYYIEAYP